MLKALRAGVNAVLAETAVRRSPALRRSDTPDALLATDLPFAADAEAVVEFIARMTADGWRVWPAVNGWLLLDTEVPVPAGGVCTAEGECACCISLLQRHPDSGEAKEEIRALVKAAEAGAQAFERYCEQLHHRLAARLRQHEPLPGVLLPYLQQAYLDLHNRREKL